MPESDFPFEAAPWEVAADADRPPEPSVWPESYDLDEPDEPSSVIALLADDTQHAVALFRDPDAVQAMTADLSESLVFRVRDLYSAQRHMRHLTDPGKPPHDADVAAELQMLADAHDTLKAISRAVLHGAEEAKGISGEVLAEIEPDERKSHSVRVGDGHGWDLKVSRQQQTEAVANLDEVIDVVVAHCIAEFGKPSSAVQAKAFAQGLRRGIAALLPLLSAPKVATTRLDAFKRRLEGEDEHDLAIRLGHAYGRASKGEPRISIERIQPKEEK